MSAFLENLIARTWNRLQVDRNGSFQGAGLDLGSIVIDGQPSRNHFLLPHIRRAEHVAILGRTGTGKSSEIKNFASQDIRENRGFVYFDLHGDAMPHLLRLVAAEETRRRTDLSENLIVIEPGDAEYSIGLNVLEQRGGNSSFLQITEFAQILKQRWGLEHFGARTEELLRNSLLALSESGHTLLELSPLLANGAFRASCLRHVRNTEVKAYFEERYDQVSDAQQAVFRDAILNKVTAFTADPHFRHILGQTHSTFSLLDAVDRGCWVILNLDKGRLGEQALTLGALFLTKLKNALFARQTRRLFTLYCDEVQNLVAIDTGIDTLLSEARKFGISLVSANQFLDQYPPQMRSAILAINTHVFFRLSASDAEKISQALDGGRALSEILKNLPQRHMIVKSGHTAWREVAVPEVPDLRNDYTDLYNRARKRWAKRRADIEAEIQARHREATHGTREALREWE